MLSLINRIIYKSVMADFLWTHPAWAGEACLAPAAGTPLIRGDFCNCLGNQQLFPLKKGGDRGLPEQG